MLSMMLSNRKRKKTNNKTIVDNILTSVSEANATQHKTVAAQKEMCIQNWKMFTKTENQIEKSIDFFFVVDI